MLTGVGPSGGALLNSQNMVQESTCRRDVAARVSFSNRCVKGFFKNLF
jgi:hypothetical protein